MQSLKHKNRIKDHGVLVDKIKEEFGSLRKAAKAYNLHWRTFNRLCQPPVPKKKATQDTWVDIRSIYKREIISQPLPSICCKGRMYLTKPLEESYSLYKEECMKLDKKSVGFSTFCHLRPKDVFKIPQTPDQQCICDQCKNFRLL